MKTVIITGGNSGLGYQCAKHITLHTSDWFVLLACRNNERGAAAVRQLRTESGRQSIDFVNLDLSSLNSVRSLVQQLSESTWPPLAAIVCNAAAAPTDDLTYTQDGLETTFGVNYLGHFALVLLLFNQLQPFARIVLVSSELHRSDWPMWFLRPDYTTPERMAHPPETDRRLTNAGAKRYANSKLCLVLLTYELAERMRTQGHGTLTVNAINPGFMADTGMSDRATGVFQRFFLRRVVPLLLGKAASTAARSGQAVARLVTNPALAGVSGRYFDRERIVASSNESYDKHKAATLWQASVQLSRIQATETRLLV